MNQVMEMGSFYFHPLSNNIAARWLKKCGDAKEVISLIKLQLQSPLKMKLRPSNCRNVTALCNAPGAII